MRDAMDLWGCLRGQERVLYKKRRWYMARELIECAPGEGVVLDAAERRL